MSCYIIGHEKLNLILSFINKNPRDKFIYITGKAEPFDYYKKGERQAFLNKLANILLNQNAQSFKHRYNESANVSGFDFEMIPQVIDMPQKYIYKALVALDEYDYQACETQDYWTTDAAKIINKIRKLIVQMLPGYREIQGWG